MLTANMLELYSQLATIVPTHYQLVSDLPIVTQHDIQR